MTKLDIIKEIGLNDYYGEKQEEATKRLLQQPEGRMKLALKIWRKTPDASTREFISRVLTGIFKFSGSVNEIKSSNKGYEIKVEEISNK